MTNSGSDTLMAKRSIRENSYSFYEFFSGAGMARLGLQKMWKCVWANDNDPRKLSIYEHNFGKDHIDPRDVAICC